MSDNVFITYAKQFVSDYQKEIGMPVDPEDVYVVWSCKTLQNNKALLGTPISGDGMYYEVTYNGNKKEFYFDAYQKQKNICFKEI